jgi:hypothetical protein
MNPELNQYETRLIMTEDMGKMIKDYLKNNKCKPLSKKQLDRLIALLNHRESYARMQGHNEGKKSMEPTKTKEQLRVDISISIQDLAKSNAQIATCLTRALDNLK